MANILLIDDEETFSTVIGLLLETQGHKVAVAPDGASGLAMAQMRRPDLIIIDVLMPGWSGIETVKRLRGTSWGTKIPVIFLSGSINDHERRKALEVGARVFLQKPCGAELLFKTVSETLNSSGHCLRAVPVI